MPSSLLLRRCRPEDLEPILELFVDTILTVNRRDYSEAACRAWASASEDRARWAGRLAGSGAWAAVLNGKIAGFGDVRGALLDHLFVASDCQGQGIGTALCGKLEALADGPVVETFASITARPFFAARGWAVQEAQTVLCRGERLTNFRMFKRLK